MHRASDFRFIYANTFAFQVTDNDAIVTFSMMDVQTGPAGALDQVAIVMTPKSLKLLAHVATLAVENWEKANGTVIPLSVDKIKEIEDSIVRAQTPPKG